MSRDELEAVYRNTIYCVDHPGGGFGIRIGETCVALDALLHESGVTTWAFISACNPHSQALSRQENAVRHSKLLVHVRELGLRVFSGRGKAVDSDWVEESLLILGIDEKTAASLGAAFGQNAVVAGKAGEIARLMWCFEPDA